MKSNMIDTTTENKSQNLKNKEIENMNECIAPIGDWFNQEKKKRLKIAESSCFENNICPICGKEMDINERCNGAPLVNANVCNECNKRYVLTFRKFPIGTDYASTAFKHYMEAELLIEFSGKVESTIANHSDVI